MGIVTSSSSNNKNSKKILIKYLKASIISKIVSENFFNTEKYDHILINSGLYVPQGILTEIAGNKGIFTTTWEFAYKKFGYFFQVYSINFVQISYVYPL